MFIDSEGKLFGKINIVDFAVILFVLLIISGLILVKTKRHVTSSNIIEGKTKVEFDVALKFVKLTTNEQIFKVNEQSFITIRNVPYTALTIKDVQKEHVKTIVSQTSNSALPLLTDDLTNPYSYNYVVTLEDEGISTPDGVVIGGNKIKIGLPVTLEGYKYRLSGVVSNIREL